MVLKERLQAEPDLSGSASLLGVSLVASYYCKILLKISLLRFNRKLKMVGLALSTHHTC